MEALMRKEALHWVFPRNDGGRDSGFHDAGVETFKGNFTRYLARELIQNSLDARLDPSKPVHVKFEVLTLDRKEIPGMDYLQSTFKACADYWKEDEKARSFFESAAKLASKPQLAALRVGDFNTTGVSGTDSDRKNNWYHLIRCAGSSSKWSGEGGSFGIGKNAPFAASRLRTVLYSTLNSEGEHAFQGVSTLVSHKLTRGVTAQPTGFLGGRQGESIRVSQQIPPRFRRAERGLDIVALGYPASDSWQNDLVYSVLDNFWPAIDFGDLVVTVGSQEIHRSNLPNLLESFSGQEDFTAHLFYQAFKSPTRAFHERLGHLQDVSLYLYTGDVDLPKRVAMVRKTGMVIFLKGHLRSVLPFCGAFLCKNEEGNHLLREMEPPRHDDWDANHPEKGANKRIETEYMNFIRECIKKLLPSDEAKVISIPGLNRFLPDDDETPEDAFDAGESVSKTETAHRLPLPEKIEGRKIDPRRQSMQPDKSTLEGDEETEGGEGDGTGGAPGDGANETDDGHGGGGGGKGEGDAGAETGGRGGVQSKPSVPVSYRTFAKDSDKGSYSLVVAKQGNGDAAINLLVSIVGDDQRAPAEIRSAQFGDGAPITVAGIGILGPIQFSGEQTLHLELVLSEPIRVAMEVTAHEA
jgi:hypothetical protein